MVSNKKAKLTKKQIAQRDLEKTRIAIAGGFFLIFLF